ncbi:MAG: DeoR family transcriptional regulator [Bacteroides sp.]|nr:DeoR family transcriptional regulator [Bacteroides sp.]
MRNIGYACFYHVFKDRVVTKNPTRLLPEIPEGQMALQQLNNYTKNPLWVRAFHELSWVEDMGSGTRNIMRYAPLYYPGYKVEINSGSQFIFSITYADLSQETRENVPRNGQMSQENLTELNNDDLNISLDDMPGQTKTAIKRRKRQQGIIGLIHRNPRITIEEMAELLDANERTVKRDIDELKTRIEHVGPTKGGIWRIIKR